MRGTHGHAVGPAATALFVHSLHAISVADRGQSAAGDDHARPAQRFSAPRAREQPLALVDVATELSGLEAYLAVQQTRFSVA